jgi:two-component system chemotaxis response regulator CheY
MAHNILIVDDSSAIRKILDRLLRQTQMPIGNVYEAGDGIQALEALRANSVQLILCDINMPRMDGLQLLKEVRNSPQWRDVPMVLITTEGGESKVTEAVQLGASAYIRKPFTPDQIKEKLARFFRFF